MNELNDLRIKKKETGKSIKKKFPSSSSHAFFHHHYLAALSKSQSMVNTML